MFFLRIEAILILASVVWIVWYFKELPKNIRELKESRREYQKYLELSVLGEFKAKTGEDANGESCRLEYKGNLGVIIFFSAVTAAAIIYLVHSLTGLTKGVIQVFQRGF